MDEHVTIVGIDQSNRGRRCLQHKCCGTEILCIDTLVRFKAVGIVIAGSPEMAIEAVWVTRGKDQCRVGFLPRYCLEHHEFFEGKVAQVVKFNKFSNEKKIVEKSNINHGSCKAAFVNIKNNTNKSNVTIGDIQSPKRKRRMRVFDDVNTGDYVGYWVPSDVDSDDFDPDEKSNDQYKYKNDEE